MFLYDFCLPIDLCKPEAMDSESAAASERILLEPYKYLLQLPGESFSLHFFTVAAGRRKREEVETDRHAAERSSKATCAADESWSYVEPCSLLVSHAGS